MDLSNAPPARFNEQGRLETLARLDILDTAPERDFDELTRLAALALGVESAAISLIDKDRQWFKARHGIAAAQTPREVAFCRHVVASREMLVVPDATQDPRFSTNPLVQGDPGIDTYLPPLPPCAGKDFLARIAPEGTPARSGAFVDMQARRADGSPLAVELSLSLWGDGRGEDGFAVVLRDIADRK